MSALSACSLDGRTRAVMIKTRSNTHVRSVLESSITLIHVFVPGWWYTLSKYSVLHSRIYKSFWSSLFYFASLGVADLIQKVEMDKYMSLFLSEIRPARNYETRGIRKSGYRRLYVFALQSTKPWRCVRKNHTQ